MGCEAIHSFLFFQGNCHPVPLTASHGTSDYRLLICIARRQLVSFRILMSAIRQTNTNPLLLGELARSYRAHWEGVWGLLFSYNDETDFPRRCFEYMAKA
jgi:hypothetical protein